MDTSGFSNLMSSQTKLCKLNKLTYVIMPHMQVHPMAKFIGVGFLDQRVNAHMILTDMPSPGIVSIHTSTNNAGVFLFPHILT